MPKHSLATLLCIPGVAPFGGGLSLSPTGDVAAVSWNTTGAWKIWLAPLAGPGAGGRPKRITRGPQTQSAPRFSPDRCRAVILCDRGRRVAAHVLDIESGPAGRRPIMRRIFREASPVFFLSRIQAPVQMLAGAHDPRCPASETEPAAAELERLGKVHDVANFPDEGHRFLKKMRNRVKAYARQLRFVRRHLWQAAGRRQQALFQGCPVPCALCLLLP